MKGAIHETLSAVGAVLMIIWLGRRRQFVDGFPPLSCG